MKQHKVTWKITALLLAIVLISTNLPAAAIAVDQAEAIDATTYAFAETPDNIQALFEEDVQIKSVQKDDDIFTLTADIGDNKMVQKVFAVPVKYETEDGKIELIDTSI